MNIKIVKSEKCRSSTKNRFSKNEGAKKPLIITLNLLHREILETAETLAEIAEKGFHNTLTSFRRLIGWSLQALVVYISHLKAKCREYTIQERKWIVILMSLIIEKDTGTIVM